MRKAGTRDSGLRDRGPGLWEAKSQTQKSPPGWRALLLALNVLLPLYFFLLFFAAAFLTAFFAGAFLAAFFTGAFFAAFLAAFFAGAFFAAAFLAGAFFAAFFTAKGLPLLVDLPALLAAAFLALAFPPFAAAFLVLRRTSSRPSWPQSFSRPFLAGAFFAAAFLAGAFAGAFFAGAFFAAAFFAAGFFSGLAGTSTITTTASSSVLFIVIRRSEHAGGFYFFVFVVESHRDRRPIHSVPPGSPSLIAYILNTSSIRLPPADDRCLRLFFCSRKRNGTPLAEAIVSIACTQWL